MNFLTQSWSWYVAGPLIGLLVPLFLLLGNKAFGIYEIIGSAIVVGMISIISIKKLKNKTISGEEIKIATKEFTQGNIIGGLLFGLGWAITGACPAPLYALIGSGLPIVIVTLLSAVSGTYVYGLLKNKLSH